MLSKIATEYRRMETHAKSGISPGLRNRPGVPRCGARRGRIGGRGTERVASSEEHRPINTTRGLPLPATSRGRRGPVRAVRASRRATVGKRNPVIIRRKGQSSRLGMGRRVEATSGPRTRARPGSRLMSQCCGLRKDRRPRTARRRCCADRGDAPDQGGIHGDASGRGRPAGLACDYRGGADRRARNQLVGALSVARPVQCGTDLVAAPGESTSTI